MLIRHIEIDFVKIDSISLCFVSTGVDRVVSTDGRSPCRSEVDSNLEELFYNVLLDQLQSTPLLSGHDPDEAVALGKYRTRDLRLAEQWEFSTSRSWHDFLDAIAPISVVCNV